MPSSDRTESDPVAAWKRYKAGSGPLHELTENVARAIHEDRYSSPSWDHDKVKDAWLAVGSWQAAEAVVRVLPLSVGVAA